MILHQIVAKLNSYEEYEYKGKVVCCAHELFRYFETHKANFPKKVWLIGHDRPAQDRLVIKGKSKWFYCTVDDDECLLILVSEAERIINKHVRGKDVFYLEVYYEE
jgi:hypothetical protein